MKMPRKNNGKRKVQEVAEEADPRDRQTAFAESAEKESIHVKKT